MLSISDSENYYTLDSLIEKLRKEKNEKAIQTVNSHINNIKTLSNEIKKKENLLLYYNLKMNKIKDEFDEINNEIKDEENDLIERYISSVEKEEYYLSPSNLEIKDLSERARAKKNKYNKMKEDYEYSKLYIDKEEEQLEESINNLSNKEKDLFIILKEYLLNEKDMNKIKDEFDILSENKSFNETLRNNMTFIREKKNIMRNKRNEIRGIKKEIKNNYDKKVRKNMNHINYNDNLSVVKNNNNIINNNISFGNINTSLVNDSTRSFLFNDDINKTNTSIQNNISTNLNKTFFLRANKSHIDNAMTFNDTIISQNHKKIKSCSLFLKTDSSDRYNLNHKNKNIYLCKRLLKNYCNKYAENNKEFMFDMKLKEKQNQSMPKNLYHQRKKIREESDDFIYINGNRYKQSLIGKATNTVNGVY